MGRGPTALLEQHGLEERPSSASFDVAVDTVEIPDALVPEIARTFELNRRLAHWVDRTCRGCFSDRPRWQLQLRLGRDGRMRGRRGARGVVVDAHADFDVPDDNLSGFLDVMALSTLTGACWQALAATIPGFKPVPERNVLLAGARDLNDYQRSASTIGDLGLMGSR